MDAFAHSPSCTRVAPCRLAPRRALTCGAWGIECGAEHGDNPEAARIPRPERPRPLAALERKRSVENKGDAAGELLRGSNRQ